MISVCMPTYKGVPYLREALDSVLSQTYKNFEIVIVNDSVSDAKELRDLVKEYKDKRIILHQNRKNLGYPKNIKKSFDKSHGDIVFLLAQDDLLLYKELFFEINSVFKKYKEVGVVTRPYYWFQDDIDSPIRQIPKIRKRILDVRKNSSDIIPILESCGQFSGLCFRRSCFDLDFSPWVFTAHVRPFLSVLRKYKCYYLPKFTIGVRTESSQTRFLSSIYSPTPAQTWVDTLNEVFNGGNLAHARDIAIDHMCKNYVGFLQIKNYGYIKNLVSEIRTVVKYRPRNLVNPMFWIYGFVTLVTPRRILRKVVDLYKVEINKKKLKGIV